MTVETQKASYPEHIWMPDGKGGVMPAPAILTREEALRFLRIDELGVNSPGDTLDYYRKKGLRSVQIGKRVRFTLWELLDFVRQLGEINPR